MPTPDNRYTTGAVAADLGTILLGLQILFFGTRLFERAYVTRSLGWNDLIFTCGFISTIVHYTSTALVLNTGYVGYYNWNISPVQLPHVLFLNSNLFVFQDPFSLTYGVAIIFMKLSFSFSYWQKFYPSRWKSIAILTNVSLTGMLYVVYQILALLYIVRLRANLALNQHTGKEESLVFVPALSAISAFYDFYLLCLLLGDELWQIKLNFRNKCLLSILFLSRISTCIYLILTAHYQDMQIKSKELLEETLALNLISFTEMQIGIICCCVPPLLSIVRHVNAKYRINTSGTVSNEGTKKNI